MPCSKHSKGISVIYHLQFHGSANMRIKPGQCKKECTEKKCFFQIKILDLIPFYTNILIETK